jgi:hypothetical protein
MRKVTSVVAIVAASVIGIPSMAGAQDNGDGTYTVERGNTLFELNPLRWDYVCIQNVAQGVIPDCDTLQVGDRLDRRVSVSEQRAIDVWFDSLPEPVTIVVPEPEPQAVPTAPEPAPAPEPVPHEEPAPATTHGLGAPHNSTWDALALCESGGDWAINTGNGYSGGLQFHPDTWASHGGQGQAHEASREEQIQVAERVLDSQGWGAWPACSSQLGLR